MGIESYISLPVGAATAHPADTARFRVGSCRLAVLVNGESFDAGDFSATFADNGLPLCTVAIPIGTAVGALAVQGAQTNTLARLRATFTKYAPVTVTMTVASIEATDDIGNAFKPGTHTIFEGYISSTRVVADGRSAVSLFIRVSHKLVGIATGTPLFSKLCSENGFGDYQQLLKGYFGIEGIKPGPKPWDVFQAIAEQFVTKFRSAAELGFGPGATATGDYAKIKAALTRSTSLLSSIASVAELKYAGNSAVPMETAMMRELFNIIAMTQGNMNFLAAVGRAAMNLSCALVFTRSQGYFIPWDPLWKSAQMKVLRGGMVIQQEYSRNSGYSTIREGYDITGTIVRAAIQGGYLAPNLSPPLLLGATWLMPSTDLNSQFSLIDEAFLPYWLCAFENLTVSATGAPGAQKLDKVRPICAVDTRTKATGDPSAAAARSQSFVEVATNFAYYNTMMKNVGSNTLIVTTALRDDVIPGMNLAVDTQTPDGDSYKVYGQVAEVSPMISVANKTAVVVIKLRYVRGEAEQKIIDNEDKEHYAWKRADTALNALSLWD